MKLVANIKYCIVFFVYCFFFGMVAKGQSVSSGLDSEKFILQKNNWAKDTVIGGNLLGDSNRLQMPQNKNLQPAVQLNNTMTADVIFYFFLGLLLFLGLLKAAYGKYFSNLTRVFFNTSLKQGQLTDQLLQAKLPSLLLNIFFVLTVGLYVFLLMVVNKSTDLHHYTYLLYAMLFVLVAYLVKYFVINITGWLTGFSREASGYIFIVFLVNKIMSLALLPLVVVMAFSNPLFQKMAMVFSWVLIFLLLLIRYYRSFGLLKNNIKLSLFHFLLFVIGVEVLPMLIIYKWALNILNKSL